jgi:hypothetical protein
MGADHTNFSLNDGVDEMATTDQLQQVWHHYDDQREHQPSGTREAAEWAVAEGLLELPTIDPLDILARQMARALREETQMDEHGRRYRVNHAMRVTTNGVQYSFWAMMGYASHEHMEKTFAQRREHIIGECLQLKTDVDVYNDLTTGQHPAIQLVLDFTEDVAEREVYSQADEIEFA